MCISVRKIFSSSMPRRVTGTLRLAEIERRKRFHYERFIYRHKSLRTRARLEKALARALLMLEQQWGMVIPNAEMNGIFGEDGEYEDEEPLHDY